jgi:signal transduction histidine kinase
LKFNFKGIRFSTWLYFLGFSLTIMLLLGFLLVVLIKPYYRNDRLNTIDTISETIENLLLKKNVNNQDIESAARTIVGNNVCAIIYNENGKSIYSPPDSLGQLCMLDKQITVGDMTYTIKDEPEKMIALIKNYNPFSQTIYSQFTGIEMLLYGKQLKTNLANYYLILNTPLEPVESYIDFIMNQYLYLAMIVIVISLILAFFLAKNISQPIIKMKNEANKLAQGDYDAKFETNSFSEINDLASTLDDATEKLSKINDLRKDLIANVSHDIKTPLTMIKAYAEMIKDISGEDPKKRNEHLDVIIQESEYLDKLVSDMSELSKLQSGVIEINRDNFDMKECVGRVVVLLSKAAEEKNVQLIVNCDDCVAYADEIKISQVIYNFLSNA